MSNMDLWTDRELLAQLLVQEIEPDELAAFASMQERLAADGGMYLSERQRRWAEQVAAQCGLSGPPDRSRKHVARRRKGGAQKYWWDGSDPAFHPLRPPGK